MKKGLKKNLSKTQKARQTGGMQRTGKVRKDVRKKNGKDLQVQEEKEQDERTR